jgi:hypothetical protein
MVVAKRIATACRKKMNGRAKSFAAKQAPDPQLTECNSLIPKLARRLLILQRQRGTTDVLMRGVKKEAELNITKRMLPKPVSSWT